MTHRTDPAQVANDLEQTAYHMERRSYSVDELRRSLTRGGATIRALIQDKTALEVRVLALECMVEAQAKAFEDYKTRSGR